MENGESGSRASFGRAQTAQVIARQIAFTIPKIRKSAVGHSTGGTDLR
ncbi:hypothetical protein Lokhon_01986 [Limimaricola hongkongensis DSM 17492]|uniref:Uncharacterized protein n=1 Tax=Limimaricola hongkongensis DSM 17492 TaxID=1122180 RepID=A0A017HC75_9RHOB|nr:hypothetical protein Lokhon_01986 [Limimaricola hongkongensis DSM 17492]